MTKSRLQSRIPANSRLSATPVVKSHRSRISGTSATPVAKSRRSRATGNPVVRRETLATPRLQSSPAYYSAPVLRRWRFAQSSSQPSTQRLWQEIIYLLLAIIIIPLAFILIVFPIFISTSAKINSKKYQPENLSVKPQMPMFDAPAAFTNQVELKIKGFASPENKVQFVFNGSSSPEYALTVGISGEFTFTFTLEPGENTIKAYSLSKDGISSSETKTYSVFLDLEKPELELLSPKEKKISGRENRLLTLSGKTEPFAKVLVGNVQDISNSQGEFSLSYPLADGINNLQIVVSDRAGNTNQWEEVIDYQP